VATLPTDAGTARGLSDRPLGKVAIVLAVLLAAFIVSKSCGAVGDEISQEQAVAIAREQIDYEPERVMVRLLKRGLKSRPYWAVSLATFTDTGALERATVVVVDARTGEVGEIRRGS
jgi:hypothetical protein